MRLLTYEERAHYYFLVCPMASRRRGHQPEMANERDKRQKQTVSTQYYGLLVNDVRKGLYRTTVTGDCNPMTIVGNYKNGVMDGEQLCFDTSSGKWIYNMVLENNNIVTETNFTHQEKTFGTLDEFSGARWEGSIIDGKANGEGKYYSNDNYLAYEGFMIDNKFEGKGTLYYVDTHTLMKEYEGDWCQGKKHGYGNHYNRLGVMDYSGWWIEDMPVPLQIEVGINDNEIICTSVLEKIAIASNAYNNQTVLSFTKYSCLQAIVIGDHSCKEVRHIVIQGLEKLELIIIGEGSFTTTSGMVHLLNMRKGPFFQEKQLIIKSCMKLESILIGRYSFSEYSVCTIEDCPSLTQLTIGNANHHVLEEFFSYNFFHADKLQLSQLPKLEEVVFGNASFYNSHSVYFYNLPLLNSIKFGAFSFYGTSRDKENPNRVEFARLPVLSTFCAYNKSFYTFITLAVNLELPQLVDRKTIRVYGEAFKYTNCIQRGFNVPGIFLECLGCKIGR